MAGELKEQGISGREDDFLEAHKASVLEKLMEIEKDKGHDGQNQLIKEIVEMEWQQFQNVHNEGGRAPAG